MPLSKIDTRVTDGLFQSIAALKAATPVPGQVAFLNVAGGGTFVWTLAADYPNLAEAVAADTMNGMFVKADSVATSVGAWVRRLSGYVKASYWRASAASTAAQNDAAFKAIYTIIGTEIVDLDGETLPATSYPAGCIWRNGNFLIDGAIVPATRDPLKTASVDMYPIDTQPAIAEFAFGNVSSTVSQKTNIPPSKSHPSVVVSPLTEVNGTNSIGTRVGKPFGATQIPGSDTYPSPCLEVGMDATTTTLASTSYGLQFSVAVPAGMLLGLHNIKYDLGYDSDYEDGLWYRPRTQVYYSLDGTTWTVLVGPVSISDVTARFTARAVTGSAGAHYVENDRGQPLTSPATQFKVSGGQTIYFRICMAEATSATGTENRRRIVVARIRLDGTVAKDISALATHSIIHSEALKFCGWPANGFKGFWGNRYVFSFEKGDWVDNPSGHDIDYATDVCLFAVSSNAGATWGVGPKANVVQPGDVSPGDVVTRPAINFTDGNSAFMARDQWVWTSNDRAMTFSAPSRFTSDTTWNLKNRTAIIPTGSNSAVFFGVGVRASPTAGQTTRERALIYKTTDGGATWQYKGMFGAEGLFNTVDAGLDAYSLMPQAVKLGDRRYIVAIREAIQANKWIAIYETCDDFDTPPVLLARIGQDNHNPPAIVSVGGEDLVVLYGSRENGVQGMCATISRDGGKTWSIPGYFRTDALSWDFGYPVAHARDDGTIWTAYYYHTASNVYQHIAQSIINVSDLKTLPALPFSGA